MSCLPLTKEQLTENMSFTESSEETEASDRSLVGDENPDWLLAINVDSPNRKNVITSGDNGFRIFYPKNEGTKGGILLLRQSLSLAVTGKLAVKVLWGMLDVYGFVMKPNHNQFFNIFSPISSSLLTVKTAEIEQPSKVSVMESRERVCSSLVQQHNWSKQDAIEAIKHIQSYSVGLLIDDVPDHFTHPHLQKFYPSLFQSQATTRGVPSLMLPTTTKCELFDPTTVRSIYCEDWYNITESLKNYSQEEVPKVLICGGKNVGKSTMFRFLLNSMLNGCDAVCCIDGDPGQSEFTPPGLLSLCIIREPCLGPGFVQRRTPEKAIFIGSISAADHPMHYISSIKDLVCLYSEKYSKLPLIINTMGWNRGIGMALLSDMIHIIQPSHVIQLDTKVFPHRNFPWLSVDAMEQCCGWSIGLPSIKKPYIHIVKQSMVTFDSDHNAGIKLREINLTSYMCDFQSSNKPWQGIHRFAFNRISWSSIALHVIGGMKDYRDILYVFNGSLVALCECDTAEVGLLDSG
ncbi:Polynucleotide 5'-hydroxyl-kinase nol9, variant 2 [Chamberlinius hualienensis]